MARRDLCGGGSGNWPSYRDARLSTTMPESTYRFMAEIHERQIQELHTLYQGEWWTRGRSVNDVKTMLEHSNFVFALCD